MTSYTRTDAEGREVATLEVPSQIAYALTPTGVEFVKNWAEAKPLN